MKFALNYSPQAAELLGQHKIDIDLFKCPPWENLVPKAQARQPVYIHFEFQAGWQRVETAQLRAAEMWLARTGTRYVNTHIVPNIDALRDPDSAEEIIQQVMNDLMPLVEYFGADRVIAENIPYPETKRIMPRHSVDPAVITQIIDRSGSGLLLDIGHARRTAEHLAIDPRLYIEQLPVHRLREIHITGLGYDANGKRTDHMPMREDDWELFAWALDHIRSKKWATPGIIACEYGGVGGGFEWRSDIQVIADQIPRMAEMVRAAQPEHVETTEADPI
jgi:uncharacterized protein (UPF0276 family)